MLIHFLSIPKIKEERRWPDRVAIYNLDLAQAHTLHYSAWKVALNWRHLYAFPIAFGLFYFLELIVVGAIAVYGFGWYTRVEDLERDWRIGFALLADPLSYFFSWLAALVGIERALVRQERCWSIWAKFEVVEIPNAQEFETLSIIERRHWIRKRLNWD